MKGCGVRRGGKYADGLASTAAGALRGRGAQIDAAVDGAQTAAPQRVAAPQPPPQSKSYEQLDAEIAAARAKMNAPKKFLGMFRDGAVIPGHDASGKDDVPVKVTRGEAILPVKTVDAMGGPMAVSDMIHATNGKPPAGVRRGGRFADGATPSRWADASGAEKKPNYGAGREIAGKIGTFLSDPTNYSPAAALVASAPAALDLAAKNSASYANSMKSDVIAADAAAHGGQPAGVVPLGNEGRSVPAPATMTPEQAHADIMAGGQGNFRGGSIRPDLAGKTTPVIPTSTAALLPPAGTAPAEPPTPAATRPVPDAGFVGGPAEAAGVRRPAAQTPIPAGTGFITNNQTGVTTQVGTPSAVTAPAASATSTRPSGQGSLLDQADEYVNRVAAGQPPEVRAQTRLDFIKAAGGAAQAESAQASAGKTRQETSEQQRLIDLQGTALDETLSPEKRTAAQTALKARTGATRYQPMMGKDEMGNPIYIGSFDRETGKTEMAGAQPQAAAQTRPVGTISTVNGKSAKWDGKQWQPM